MNKDYKRLRVQNTFCSNQWLCPHSIKLFRKSLKIQQIWVFTVGWNWKGSVSMENSTFKIPLNYQHLRLLHSTTTVIW